MPYLTAGASIIITSSVVGLISASPHLRISASPSPHLHISASPSPHLRISAPSIAGYSTAKHAQVGLMRTLARELAPCGIRVNTIHPGPVDNEFQHRIEVSATGAEREGAAAIFEQMIPLARHAAPDEIARAVLFLASDDSSFVTGTTLAVDGGMSG